MRAGRSCARSMYFHGHLSQATQVPPCGYRFRGMAERVSLRDQSGGGAMDETCHFRRTCQTSGSPCREIAERTKARPPTEVPHPAWDFRCSMNCRTSSFAPNMSRRETPPGIRRSLSSRSRSTDMRQWETDSTNMRSGGSRGGRKTGRSRATYSTYERLGYRRFALNNVTFTNRTITLNVKRLDAWVPTV